jgi:hypothetical protein
MIEKFDPIEELNIKTEAEEDLLNLKVDYLNIIENVTHQQFTKRG